MRRDQVINGRRELNLRQVTAAGEHDETSMRERGSEQFSIRRRRRDAVFLPLNHQQGHRKPGSERGHLRLGDKARRLHETDRVGRAQGLLYQSQSIGCDGRTEQCRCPVPESIAAAFDHARTRLDALSALLGRRSVRDAGAGEHHAPDPPGAIIGKSLRDARAERVGDDVEPIDPEGRQQVIKRI